MIAVGSVAPDFALPDQRGHRFRLHDQQGRNVLLLWYPADFTPTCSWEVPTLDDLSERFLREANTIVVAISTDSRFSHAQWAEALGGVSIPILSDANPHGEVSRAYGAWLPDESISDRATVLVGPDGRVRYAASVGKDGRRNIDTLLRIAKGEPAPRLDLKPV